MGAARAKGQVIQSAGWIAAAISHIACSCPASGVCPQAWVSSLRPAPGRALRERAAAGAVSYIQGVVDMVRANDEVAAVLQEYADLMAITGGDAFRVRTYEKAARSVGGYPDDISQLDEKGLRQIPNVGASIAGKIEEHLRTG